MSNYILSSNGELMHYGVKGMKWGVNKSQRKLNKAVKTADKQAKRRRKLADNYKRTLEDIRRGNYKELGYPSAERAKQDKPLTSAMISNETKIAKNWTKIRNEIAKMSVNDVAKANELVENGKQYAAYMDDMIYSRIEYERKNN